MGVTIHYRGTVDEIERIEGMEDRVTELVFALGGRATIWRSFADHDPTRVVRGMMIEMAPGQETFSLLVSPEGHFAPLHQIEDAERAPFDEPPCCFVKTQFGSIEGHVAIVQLLDALKEGYCSNLEISDESEYYESRDVAQLAQKMQILAGAIESLADGLREHGLSKEAAEDPRIVASRVERVAKLVHQRMLDEPSEKTSAADQEIEEQDWREHSLEEEVDAMDRHRRKNALRAERITRRISEATAAGMTAEAAFATALQEEGLEVPIIENDSSTPSQDKSTDQFSQEEAWQPGLPPHPFDEASELVRLENHPAVGQAKRFLMDVMELEPDDPSPDSFFSIACRGAMDIVGGLVQATCDGFDTRIHRALAISQLKRALTGHAYARGAIFGLRSTDHFELEVLNQLEEQLAAILISIHELSSQAWDEPDFGI